MNFVIPTDFASLFIDFLIIVKGFYLLGLFMYLIFAGVVIRQVEMMLSSLSGVLQLPLRPLAWIHFITAFVIFLAAALLL